MKKCPKCNRTYTGRPKTVNGVWVCKRCWEMEAYKAQTKKKEAANGQ